jgi:hypothetical protein
MRHITQGVHAWQQQVLLLLVVAVVVGLLLPGSMRVADFQQSCNGLV